MMGKPPSGIFAVVGAPVTTHDLAPPDPYVASVTNHPPTISQGLHPGRADR